MQLNDLFLKSGVSRILEEKDFCAVDMVFSIIGAFIYRAKGLQNDANMTNVQRMYFDIMSEVVLQNYGQGWFVAEQETFAKRRLCVYPQDDEHVIACMHIRQATLKLHFLDNMEKDISRFGSLSALDASPCNQYNKSMKAVNLHASRRFATRMDRVVFSLEQFQNDAS